ncbi:MAG: CxxxxCH/CxxCH domain-containing protein [Alphaproteobacteria bacterium]|nr:CxxxxCH/CxxCH domain-containing protein [Alphaproteobacteria bacterium]
MSLFVLALFACTPDTPPPAPTADDTGTPEEPPPVEQPAGFLTGELCLVRTVFETSCTTGCHSSIVAGGGLDLQTNPWAALVNRPSGTPGAPQLVVPGDSLGSFLFLKMGNFLEANQGEVMPPQGQLGGAALQVVKDWIDNGAANDCDISPPGGDPPPPPPPPPPPDPDPDPDPDPQPTDPDPQPTDPDPPPPTSPHPVGYSSPDQHGVAANLQLDGDCRSCHGANFEGGTGMSCDTCHQVGWRTDCTFCHGGQDNQSGAPPQDVDGTTAPNLISFPDHTAHIQAGYGCSECHYTPTDYLTNGHVFGDVTPGYGEVNYAAGLSYQATYFLGTCSNAYCHGNGQGPNGTVTAGSGPVGCASCHYNQNSTPAEWNQMSGRHRLHLQENGVTCSNCHASTVDAAGQIVGAAYHLNGTPDVASVDITIVGTTCDGACHGFNHNNRGW